MITDDVRPQHRPQALTDLYDIARLLRRTGVRDIRVTPHEFTVAFTDPRYHATSALSVVSECDQWWYWRWDIDTPQWVGGGPIGENRFILYGATPRRVIRAYEHEVRAWQRTLPRKRRST